MCNSSRARWSTFSAIAQVGQAGTLTAVLGPRWLHLWHQDREWERSNCNMAAFEQGVGHPNPSCGLAESTFVLGLPSAVPMAKAVLAVLLAGGEMRGVQMDFIFSSYYCQSPQGAALQGCLARGSSGETIPEHPT